MYNTNFFEIVIMFYKSFDSRLNFKGLLFHCVIKLIKPAITS